MSNGELAEQQAANVTPPTMGAIFAVTLDATSRAYDLGLLALGGAALAKGGYICVTLSSSVACYFGFDSVSTATVDETAALAAGGTAAFAATYGWKLPADVEQMYRIHRTRHRYLIVKGSAAGILRIAASSDSTEKG